MTLHKMHSQSRHVCTDFTQGISCELNLKKKMKIGIWVDGEYTRKESSLDNDRDLGESTTCSEKSQEEFRIAGTVSNESGERGKDILDYILFMWSHETLLIAIIINGSQFLKHIYVIGTKPTTLHTQSNLILPIALSLFFSFSSLSVI